jgi:hypothetical protein
MADASGKDADHLAMASFTLDGSQGRGACPEGAARR